MSTKSSAASTDLRAVRTRKWLQDALLTLMTEKPYRAIQITEIADRAQVSRPAFYLHFRSKEELLISHVDALFEAFHTALIAEIDAGRFDRRAFCVMLFDYWARDAETLRMVLTADIQPVLLGRIRDYFALALAEVHARSNRPPREGGEGDLVVDFAAGGAYMLLTRWIAEGQPRPARQMGELLYDLLGSCV